jgi:hypothetical protein
MWEKGASVNGTVNRWGKKESHGHFLPSSLIPGNANPQMAAFMTTRNQLRQSLIQLRTQNASSTPAVRNAALQQWRQQNASQFTQLQQQAQALPPSRRRWRCLQSQGDDSKSHGHEDH